MQRDYRIQGAYTTKIYNAAIDDNTDFLDISKVLDFFKHTSFRTFGEGIAELIRSRDKEAVITNENEFQKYIFQKCKEAGISTSLVASRGTLLNWYTGVTRPNRVAASRESLFVLSFALNFSTNDVKNLFHKVYMDRFVDSRNYKEVVYLYCIKKAYSFRKATEIIETIQKNTEKTTSEVISTLHLSRNFEVFETDDELVKFICENWNNFQFNNIKALKIFYNLFSDALKHTEKEYEKITYDPNKVDNDILFERAKKGAIEAKSIMHEKKEKARRGPSLKSDSFVYKMITGSLLRAKNSSKKFNNVLGKDSAICKEVKKNFPKITTISKFASRFKSRYESPAAYDSEADAYVELNCENLHFNDDYDELRKCLIFLKFYNFYYKYEKNLECDDFYIYDVNLEEVRESFKNETDDLLIEVGMPPLYPANPYDLFFLICTYDEAPLYTWRETLTEILGDYGGF